MQSCKCFSHASTMPNITYNGASCDIIKNAIILNLEDGEILIVSSGAIDWNICRGTGNDQRAIVPVYCT